jgi:hypothetical protein
MLFSRFNLLHFFSKDDPAMSAIRNNTMKTKNKILAIDAAPAAIPVKPNTAATIATIKNISAQRNICLSF